MGVALASYAPIEAGNSAGRSAACEGVTVADLRFCAGARLAPHAHEQATITVTLEGVFETTLEGRAFHNPLHALLAKPAGAIHGNAFGPGPVRVVMLSVDGGSEDLRRCARALRGMTHAVDVRVATLARAMAAELAAPDDLTPLALSGLARELLAAVARIEETPLEAARAAWLRRGLDFVRANLDAPLRLAAVAQVCGVHPISVARAVRAHTGESLGRYVRKLRVQRAAERLSSSEEPIADIAAALGFSDQSHLTRVFHAITGYTPASWRRLARKA